MFLTTYLLLAASSCRDAMAAALGSEQHVGRDLGSIQASLGAVNTALASLDSAILNDPANPSVLFSSIDVFESIRQATSSINTSRPLGPADTFNLKATTDSLVSNVNVTATDLISQKPLFDLLGLDKIVLAQLQSIQGAALTLASTLASKVDPGASGLALEGINALTAAIQRAVAVYDGSGSTTTTGPATPSAPAAPPPPTPVPSPPAPLGSSSPSLPSPNPPPLSPPPPSAPTGSIGPGPYNMSMPIPGTFEAGVTCMCMCPPVVACGSS